MNKKQHKHKRVPIKYCASDFPYTQEGIIVYVQYFESKTREQAISFLDAKISNLENMSVGERVPMFTIIPIDVEYLKLDCD
jgi:hypothetical protein